MTTDYTTSATATYFDERGRRFLLRMFIGLILGINLVVAILYVDQRLYVLWGVAAFDVAALALALVFLDQRRYLLALQIAVIDVVVSASLASCLLGWTSYYSLYLVAAAIFVINTFSMKLRWKIVEVVVISVLFALLLACTVGGFKVNTIDERLLHTLGAFNMLASVFALFYMSFHNLLRHDALKKQLEELADTDILTGAYNRRFFDEYLDLEKKRLESEIKYGHTRDVSFGIAMIDIDDFKEINDTCGHLAGDGIIAQIAHTIRGALFERDLFCRFGGEEFVVLFTSTSRAGALIAIEKVRETVYDSVFTVGQEAHATHVTVSIGFASYEEETNVHALLDLADKRLYAAKRAGKNRVVTMLAGAGAGRARCPTCEPG